MRTHPLFLPTSVHLPCLSASLALPSSLSPFLHSADGLAATPRPSEVSFSPLLALQDSLPEKLAVHEKNVREFDAFVETLQ